MFSILSAHPLEFAAIQTLQASEEIIPGFHRFEADFILLDLHQKTPRLEGVSGLFGNQDPTHTIH